MPPSASSVRPPAGPVRTAVSLDDLRELLGGTALGWLHQQVRARLEGSDDDDLGQVLQLLTATSAQRLAALDLLGPAAVRGTRVAVRVEEVEQLLLELLGWDHGLAAAVRALDGELVLVPTTAPAAVAGPTAPHHPPSAAVPALPSPSATAPASPTRAPAPVPAPPPGPAPPPVPVVQVPPPAARPRTPLQELDGPAADAAGQELADVVLALGLPVERSGLGGAAVGAWRDAGQPVVLTLRQLRQEPLVWRPAPRGGIAFVCATPSVVAALAVAGPPEPGRVPVPVVCLDASAASSADDPAWPGEAVVLVLEELRAAGWQLRVNGGSGPEGAVLTELLAGELRAEPWRTTDDAISPPPAGDDDLAVADPAVPLLRQLVADVRRRS